jgi:hypothetical protein
VLLEGQRPFRLKHVVEDRAGSRLGDAHPRLHDWVYLVACARVEFDRRKRFSIDPSPTAPTNGSCSSALQRKPIPLWSG